MWFKSNWTNTDHREHEFISANRAGLPGYRGVHNLVKFGRYSWCNQTASPGFDTNSWRASDNCLGWATDGTQDSPDHRSDYNTYLHGGLMGVPATGNRESPSYHIQPFRWGSIGGAFQWNAVSVDNPSTEFSGWYQNQSGLNLSDMDHFARVASRPFVDSQRQPEGANFGTTYFWKDAIVTKLNGIDIATPGTIIFSVNQQLGWPWQDGVSTESMFGINNLPLDKTNNNIRIQPTDGTCAVIDELKICTKMWTTDRIFQEQTTCRYYTPDYPGDRSACPVFTSQSMLQSQTESTSTNSDSTIQVTRVLWTAFNPRFNYENKLPKLSRKEFVTQSVASQKFRGPFDYIQYNLDVEKAMDVDVERALDDMLVNNSRKNEGTINDPMMIQGISVSPLGCERPSPADYKSAGATWSHASGGVEVEIVKDTNAKASSPAVDGLTFLQPEDNNAFGIKTKPAVMKASELHYRVRFRYHIDPLGARATGGGGTDVDPSLHFVLDTPVFDDITIVYMTSSMPILKFKEDTE